MSHTSTSHGTHMNESCHSLQSLPLEGPAAAGAGALGLGMNALNVFSGRNGLAPQPKPSGVLGVALKAGVYVFFSSTYIHTYIHIYIYTYICTYINTYIRPMTWM